MAKIRKEPRPIKHGLICSEKPVLVIEDQRSLGVMLQGMLGDRWACDVHLATSLAETKSLLDQGNKYLVALTDLNLPDAQYDAILDTLQSYHVPAVALTGEFGDELREKILAKGVVDYILKESMNANNYAVELVGRLIKNKQLTALVVDDSKAIRLMLKQVLETNGLRVIEAENGRDGLEKLLKNPATKLVLTDYNMPEKNGVELTVAARKKFGKEQLAIIGMSDTDGSVTTARFLKNGANDFIHKPFKFEEIITRVNHNLDMLDLLEESYKAANFDFLTQLYNRRAFFNFGQTAVGKAFEKNTPISVAMMDIDFFKKINDNYGHDAGDVVLSEFAQLLNKHFHDQITARLGGEEFAVVMTGIPESLANKRFERFRAAIEDMIFDADGSAIKATMSIGLVSNQDNNDLDELLLLADKNLYEAKQSGRNRIVN